MFTLKNAPSLPSDKTEAISPHDAVEFILQEARMILPGIQALFGFQLIVVFHPTFDDKLVQPERLVHLLAIVLTIISIGLLMAPAAYDRQTGPGSTSTKFIRLATNLITWGLVPLMLSMVLDFYLIARVITENFIAALAGALFSLLFLSMLWFFLPRLK